MKKSILKESSLCRLKKNRVNRISDVTIQNLIKEKEAANNKNIIDIGIIIYDSGCNMILLVRKNSKKKCQCNGILIMHSRVLGYGLNTCLKIYPQNSAKKIRFLAYFFYLCLFIIG